MYACLLFTGVARTFQQPAKASLLPQIVPRRRFGNAVTWNTGAFQLASIVGPGLAGVLIAASVGFAAVYVLDAVASLMFVASLSFVKDPPMPEERPLPTFDTLVAGVGFVWRTKIILAAMTLDMLAVLLGGAVTLLPVFAGKDLLNVGAVGFGCMRAAPALGALVMMLWLAFRPPMLNAGASLLRSVAGFGVATIVFGFSRSYLLSLAMLFLIGAFDMVSVVVRHTLVQLLTPDEMRGRVSAVNSMFIGASNELGGFESGTVAYYFGPIASVVSGGIGTLATVLGVAWMWPQLGKYGRLDESVEIGPDITESESAMP
jgi:MFS family permease